VRCGGRGVYGVSARARGRRGAAATARRHRHFAAAMDNRRLPRGIAAGTCTAATATFPTHRPLPPPTCYLRATLRGACSAAFAPPPPPAAHRAPLATPHTCHYGRVMLGIQLVSLLSATCALRWCRLYLWLPCCSLYRYRASLCRCLSPRIYGFCLLVLSYRARLLYQTADAARRGYLAPAACALAHMPPFWLSPRTSVYHTVRAGTGRDRCSARGVTLWRGRKRRGAPGGLFSVTPRYARRRSSSLCRLICYPSSSAYSTGDHAGDASLSL